jgi:DNA-binding NtrC family response regulator
MVTAAHVPSVGRTPSAHGVPLTLAEVERRHITAALARTGWHQGRAAGELGISVKTLYRKIRAYGLRRPEAPPP